MKIRGLMKNFVFVNGKSKLNAEWDEVEAEGD
jgi:hypothetical protein